MVTEIREYASRYGRLQLRREDGGLVLEADDESLAVELEHRRQLGPLLERRITPRAFAVADADRGPLKRVLIRAGFPVDDLAGYVDGEPLELQIRARTLEGQLFELRDYQRLAAEAFAAGGGVRGGSGVIVLPCGAGKTIVGIACMASLRLQTLVLTTSVTAARQWLSELRDKTTLGDEQIGEYSGEQKAVRPVTVSTYQIITYRPPGASSYPHFALFDRRQWGLIVYDEVQTLPAPVFQITAGLQARRRLGLTATLVREDGREDEVFALIGPKKTDVPWKVLESQGWIARAVCTEIRIPLPEEVRSAYVVADSRSRFRIASENPAKLSWVARLVEEHRGDRILIIGLYLSQIRAIAAELAVPVLTGSTPQKTRDETYAAFRDGEVTVLAVSKIANFAVDLPDASVAIQVSGTFGSRQEEAQRLGRILRPKPEENQAHFYSLVSRSTVEQEFALKRQLFLCEQGYEYRIRDSR